jgi:hypothetical protein
MARTPALQKLDAATDFFGHNLVGALASPKISVAAKGSIGF